MTGNSDGSDRREERRGRGSGSDGGDGGGGAPLIRPAELAALLPDYIARQRWFAAQHPIKQVELAEFEVFRSEWPVLVWALANVTLEDGSSSLYQVLIGLRPLEQTERFLEGKGRGFLGDVDTDEGPALAYDALVDPELALALLGRIAPEETVELVRPLNVEQSNTSVVYDERLILKVFRRVHEGPNPDVEVPRELTRVGFENVSAPVAEWHRDRRDLAVLRTYLAGGTDGWSLALTSLRDLYGSRLPPGQSGGDFAPEARRLGRITGHLHAALAAAFGTEPGDADAWADDMLEQLRSLPDDVAVVKPRVEAVYERLRTVADPGPAIRIHGDLHLGQTMRTDSGWFLLDFEGEPARPLAERRVHSSPLRDVAGMIRSFEYAVRVGLAEQGEEVDDEIVGLGAAWADRATTAFLEGYLDVDEIGDLVPVDDSSLMLVLDAFVLHKAIYEVGYELGHRPEWVGIPLHGIDRLLQRLG